MKNSQKNTDLFARNYFLQKIKTFFNRTILAYFGKCVFFVRKFTEYCFNFFYIWPFERFTHSSITYEGYPVKKCVNLEGLKSLIICYQNKNKIKKILQVMENSKKNIIIEVNWKVNAWNERQFYFRLTKVARNDLLRKRKKTFYWLKMIKKATLYFCQNQDFVASGRENSHASSKNLKFYWNFISHSKGNTLKILIRIVKIIIAIFSKFP